MEKQKFDIHVFNENTIKNFVAQKPYLVISVRSPKNTAPLLRNHQNLIKVLFLRFHDIDIQAAPEDCKKCKSTGYVKYGKCYKCNADGTRLLEFSKADALEIIHLVEKHKNSARVIAVNCEAGISRSAGIAGALAKIYNGDDSKFFSHPYSPNMLVYRKILKVAEELGLV